MDFTVVVTANAKQNLRGAYLRAAEHAPDTASRWLRHFEEALQTLASQPKRCPLAPENDLVEPEIRQFLYGKRGRRYRVLFTIQQEQVLILHVRWGGRDLASEDEMLG